MKVTACLSDQPLESQAGHCTIRLNRENKATLPLSFYVSGEVLEDLFICIRLNYLENDKGTNLVKEKLQFFKGECIRHRFDYNLIDCFFIGNGRYQLEVCLIPTRLINDAKVSIKDIQARATIDFRIAGYRD